LRLTNAEPRRSIPWPSLWRLAGMDEAIARATAYRLGEERYRDRLMLAWARAGVGHPFCALARTCTLPQRWSAPKFPLKAADFIARGIVEGPALGQVLALAETRGWRRIFLWMSWRVKALPTRSTVWRMPVHHCSAADHSAEPTAGTAVAPLPRV